MKQLIYITVILSLLCSCRKDSAEDKIDSDIKIKMWETVDSTKRTLQFYCSTKKEYSCSNYEISKWFGASSNNVDLYFQSIIVYDFCLTSIGPATTTIDLGTLASGTYNLDIKVEQEKSEGHLIVTPDSYTIKLDKQVQLQIVNPSLKRVPENSIWGTVGYHTNATETLVQSFIDSLQFLGVISQTYPPGDYGYFKINSVGQIVPPQNHGYYFIRPFIYHYSGNSFALETLVKNYGAAYDDSLNIILYTTKGEIFRSWMQ